MSLSEGAFSSAVYADDIFAAESVNDLREGMFADMGSDADLVDGMMDMIVGRTQGFDMNRPPLQDSGAPGPEQAQQPNDPIQDAISAMVEARGMQQETTKLEAGKMTAASGQGANAVQDFAQAKGAAVENAQHAVAEARKAMKGAEGQSNAPAGPSGGGGIGGAVKNVAATSVVAAAAKVVFPGAGAAIDVAGMGSMVTSNMPTKSFKSAADTSGYSSTAGHQTVDVMAGTTTTTASPVGSALNRDMAQGPGFGPINMNEIRYGVEASLSDMRVGTMGEESLQALEADLAEMKVDADMGMAMFERWQNTGIAATEASAEMPVAELDLDEGQQMALIMDNPNLDQGMFNPLKLG